MNTRFQITQLLILSTFTSTVQAQEVAIPDPGLNAAIRDTLQKPAGPLTTQDLLSLTNLDASTRGVKSVEGLGAAHNLTTLLLRDNLLTSLTLPAELTSLTTLDVSHNQLTSLTLPADLTNLTTLVIFQNQLTNFSFLSGLTGLTTLALSGNQLTNLALPSGLTNLTMFGLEDNQLTDISFLSGLTNLTTLYFDGSQLTHFSFLSGLMNLTTLSLSLYDNHLTSFTLPAALTNLTYLYLWFDQLTRLTLPAGLTNLTTLSIGPNPLRNFVLPEPLAVTSLAGTVASLRSRGVAVYTYPLAVSLVSPQQTLAGAFGFTLTRPPAAYTILSSTDLAAWTELGTLTNALGAVVFTDLQSTNSSQKFYCAKAALP